MTRQQRATDELVDSWIHSLESWNLKYDEFPRILVIDNSLLIECGQRDTHEIEFSYAAEAHLAEKHMHEAMSRRAKDYWGIRD